MHIVHSTQLATYSCKTFICFKARTKQPLWAHTLLYNSSSFQKCLIFTRISEFISNSELFMLVYQWVLGNTLSPDLQNMIIFQSERQTHLPLTCHWFWSVIKDGAKIINISQLMNIYCETVLRSKLIVAHNDSSVVLTRLEDEISRHREVQ